MAKILLEKVEKELKLVKFVVKSKYWPFKEALRRSLTLLLRSMTVDWLLF